MYTYEDNIYEVFKKRLDIAIKVEASLNAAYKGINQLKSTICCEFRHETEISKDLTKEMYNIKELKEGFESDFSCIISWMISNLSARNSQKYRAFVLLLEDLSSFEEMQSIVDDFEAGQDADSWVEDYKRILRAANSCNVGQPVLPHLRYEEGLEEDIEANNQEIESWKEYRAQRSDNKLNGGNLCD